MNQNCKTIVIANEKCWIEQTARNQLQNVAELPGVQRVIGLPDLHAGKSPIGIAVQTQGVFYPHLIGNDIGCGMGLFQTGIALRRYKQERFVMRLNHICALEDVPTKNTFPESCPIRDLGTIGSGNHFAEFQKVEEIYDLEAFDRLAIDKDAVLLLIHSGSRGYGQQILKRFPGYEGLTAGSVRAEEYFAYHNDALLWAKRNRLLVARKLVDYLGFSTEPDAVIDCTHNFLEQRGDTFLHRKGATGAENGPIVIPGSRGSFSYLVMPTEDSEQSLYSLSHGAGRKWPRSMCKGRIREKYNRDTIRATKLKSKVVCHDTELLFQEAPEAYKNIVHIIESLLECGLIRVIATLRPLVTYKG